MSLSPAEWKLLRLIRSMTRGEVRILVRNRCPTLAEQIVRFAEEEESEKN